MQIINYDGGRDELAVYFANLGYRTGAEIGVLLGEYSLMLCQSIPGLKLYCVDPWAEHGGTNIRKRDRYLNHCKKILSPYNVEFMRMYSLDAAKDIPDGHLDFVYIDAEHLYHHVKEDINAWYPKVRAGGIVAGHDYINLPRFGVIQAVNEYMEEHSIHTMYLTHPDKTSNCPSWFWIKS